MSAHRVTVRVDLAPWVVPYLELLMRLGCGARCEPIVTAFVMANGVKVRP